MTPDDCPDALVCYCWDLTYGELRDRVQAGEKFATLPGKVGHYCGGCSAEMLHCYRYWKLKR